MTKPTAIEAHAILMDALTAKLVAASDLADRNPIAAADTLERLHTALRALDVVRAAL